MKRSDDVKNLHVRSKIVQNTLKSKIYQRLVPSSDKAGDDVGQLQLQGKGKGKGAAGQEWGDLLEDFFVAAKQLDDLQHEMKAVYSINIPVPRKERPPGGEFPFSIPQLLSPAYPKEDSDILVVKTENSDCAAYTTPASLLHAERQLLLEHNSLVDRVLQGFNLSVDEWRQNQSAAQAKGSKKKTSTVSATATTATQSGIGASMSSSSSQPVPLPLPAPVPAPGTDNAVQQKRKREV
jgi:hypothetical protein